MRRFPIAPELCGRSPVRLLRGALTTIGAVALGWLPFFLADPRTSRVLHFTIANTPLSALRALGFTDPRTPPWDRPAQALLGIALGVLPVRRGRWPAVLLLGVAARIALDPGTNRYNAAGAVVGAVVWDLAGGNARFPWWTAAAAGSLYASRWIPMPPAVHGWITLIYCIACATLLIPGIGLRSRSQSVPQLREPGPIMPLAGDRPDKRLFHVEAISHHVSRRPFRYR